MPSDFRDPKNLPEWIEQDYFRRRRGLWRWRWWLTWGTLLVCAAVMAGTAFSRRARPLYQAGPVVQAHAMFDCADCHGRHWQTARRFLPWDASATSVPDENCTQCHQGPPHSDPQSDDPVQHCAGCHREHRGRVTLTRLPDRECTVCHANIQDHSTAGKECKLRNITGFLDGHPEYAKRHAPVPSSIALSFPHDKHLDPKGVLMPPEGGQVRRKVLTCDNCHRPDEAGRFMRPVNFERDCKECHPLWVGLEGEMKGPLAKAAREFADVPAPHRAPREVRAELRDRLLGLVSKYEPAPAAAAPDLQAPLGPGQGGGARQVWEPSEGQRDMAKKLAFVVAQMGPVERTLLGPGGRCASCHGAPKPGPDGLPDFPTVRDKAPPAGGRFVHETHRMLACEQCHDVATSSTLGKPAPMPKVAKCAECHNPSAGARSDCVECHGYHKYGPGGKAHQGWTIPQALGK
jgi:hypothetical protein